MGGTVRLSELKIRLKDSNIDQRTFLATDYLNHFNEIIMLLEIAADMPDIFDEIREWKPSGYVEHFAHSGLSEGPLAIEAYEHAPTEHRVPFDRTVASMNRLIHSVVARMETLLTEDDTTGFAELSARSVERLQRLAAVADSIIHGDKPTLDQDSIDQMLADAC